MAIRFEGPMPESVIPFTSTLEDNHTAGFRGMRVDVYKLIHAVENQPIVDVPLSNHLPELKDACWSDENNDRVSPQEVIGLYKESGYKIEKATERYPALTKHFHRIIEANLNHPILTYNGQIVDGMHRFCKAVIQEEPTIKAKVLTAIPQDALIHP